MRPDRVGISPLPYGRVYGSTVELYASTALKCPRGTWGGTGVDVKVIFMRCRWESFAEWGTSHLAHKNQDSEKKINGLCRL